MNLEPLITHRFKINDAQKAYDVILGKTNEKFLGGLFEYYTKKENKTKIMISASHISIVSDSKINVGFIGIGSFAQSSLLQDIKHSKAKIIGIDDMQSNIAKNIAKKYNAKYCTSDYNKILEDDNINTIFIATRHNLHAKLIIEAIKFRKNVFCEKNHSA